MVAPPANLPPNTLRSVDDIQRLGKDIKAVVHDLEYLEKSKKEDDTTIQELETGLLRGPTVFLADSRN